LESVDGTADLAFERLYRRHRVELYRWLLRETGDPDVAEDVLQTAFVHAYRALLRGDPPREPRPWLYAIARNANRGRFRRRRVLETELDEDLPLFRDESVVWELREALAALPVNQRAAIVLQQVAGLTYAEIAERLGVTTSSVQMLVFRARRRLRIELRGERRAAGLLLPLQPVLNALSRLFGSGDRALLLRGAAGLAGAVAIGGGVLATPGDASLPARSALGAAPTVVVSAGSAHRSAAEPASASLSRSALAAARQSSPRGPTSKRVPSTLPSGPAQTPGPSASPPAGSPTSEPATPPAAAGAAVSEILTAQSTVTSTVSTTVSDTVDLVNSTVSSLPVPAPTVPDVTVPQVPVPQPQVTVPQVTVPEVPVPSALPAPLPAAPLVTP